MKYIKYYPLILFVALIAMMGGVILASDTTNAKYVTTIQVTNNGTGTASNQVTVFSLSTSDMISGSMLAATADDCAMLTGTGGSDIVFMPSTNSTNPWCTWVTNILGSSSQYQYLYSKDVTGGLIRYFPGNGGMTVPDNASLELSNNGSISFTDTWLDTTAGSGKYLFNHKDGTVGGIDCYVSDVVSGNITSSIYTSANISPVESMGGANNKVSVNNANYATTHNAVSGTLGAGIDVGQATGYWIWRGFLVFDTSAIPDNASISSAVLHLRGSNDQSVTNFDITIMTGNTTYPTNPLAVTDYNFAYYSGNGGTFNTSGFNGAGDNAINLSATGLTWISKTATTKLALLSSRDLASTTPTGNEYIQATKANTYLTVNYTYPSVSVSATGVSSAEHDVDVDIESPFFGESIDTSLVFPVADSLRANVSLGQTECNAATFTSIDSYAQNCTVSEAVWSSSGYVFDGINDNVSTGNSTSLANLSPVSYEAWIYPNTLGGGNFGMIAVKRTGTGTDVGTLFSLAPNNAIYFGIAHATNDVFRYAANGSITLGAWHHVLATWDGTALQTGIHIYVDGVECSYGTGQDAVGTRITDSFYPLLIGSTATGTYSFNGTIDEFRVYNKVISPAEDLQNYNATKSKHGTGSIYTYSTLASVPDNSNNWTFVSDNSTMYVNTIQVNKAGVLKGSWAWQYATTFTDLSGNGNTATPTFRTTSSDANVTAQVLTVASTLEPASPALANLTGWNMITGAPSTPSGMFDEGHYAFPLGTQIVETADALGQNRETWLFAYAFMVAVLAAIAVYAVTHKIKIGQRGSLILSAVVAEGVIIYFYIVTTLPGLALIPFGIIAVFLIVWRKSAAPVD